MIETKIIRKNQSLKDLCMYLYGSINQFYKLVNENSLKIDSVPRSGESVNFDNEFGNEIIKNLYKRRDIIPASKTDENIEFLQLEDDTYLELESGKYLELA